MLFWSRIITPKKDVHWSHYTFSSVMLAHTLHNILMQLTKFNSSKTKHFDCEFLIFFKKSIASSTSDTTPYTIVVVFCIFHIHDLGWIFFSIFDAFILSTQILIVHFYVYMCTWINFSKMHKTCFNEQSSSCVHWSSINMWFSTWTQNLLHFSKT